MTNIPQPLQDARRNNLEWIKLHLCFSKIAGISTVQFFPLLIKNALLTRNECKIIKIYFTVFLVSLHLWAQRVPTYGHTKRSIATVEVDLSRLRSFCSQLSRYTLIIFTYDRKELMQKRQKVALRLNKSGHPVAPPAPLTKCEHLLPN